MSRNVDENTFERQAGPRQRREALGVRDESDSAGSHSSWSDTEDDEEDLFPDVDALQADDIVCLRSEVLYSHVPTWCIDTPEPIRGDPAAQSGFRLGIVEHRDDFDDDEVPPGTIAVSFSAIDDRYDCNGTRSVEFVRKQDLVLIDRPFTVSELVVAAGRTGVVDEIDTELGVKQIPLPPFLRHMIPQNVAERCAFAAELAPVPERFSQSKTSDARSALKRLFRKKKAGQQKVSRAPNHRDAAAFPRVTLETMQQQVTYASCTQFLPLHPFRVEACVYFKPDDWVGMVVSVNELTLLAFADGSVATCAANINDIDDFVQDIDREDHAVILSRPVRIRRSTAVEHLEFLVGSWAGLDTSAEPCNADGNESGEDDPEFRDATIIALLPDEVTCMFTANNGETWDVGPLKCHPRDLVVLDYYYAEFACVLQPMFRVDDGVRSAVHDEMVARCAAKGVDSAMLIEELQHRNAELRKMQEKLKQDPHGLIGALGEEPEVNASSSTAKPCEQILRHVRRVGFRDVPSLIGALTPLEYNVFFESLYPPKTHDYEGNMIVSEEEASAAWKALMGKHAAMLPNIVQVRLTRTFATVLWNNGEVDYRRDGKSLVLSRRSSHAQDAFEPTPTTLVAPSAIRAASFPIDMTTRGYCIDESVGEFDIQQLPSDHFAAGTGDVVMMKCKEDFDMDRAHGPPMEVPKIIGQILEANRTDRVITVRWTPTTALPDVSERDTFAFASAADTSDPLTSAVGAVIEVMGRKRIGSVIRVLCDGTAVVSWWDLHEEVVPQPMLSVMAFLTAEELAAEQNGDAADGDAEAEVEPLPETAAVPPAADVASAPSVGVVSWATQLLLGAFRGRSGNSADTPADELGGPLPNTTESQPPSESRQLHEEPQGGRFVVLEDNFRGHSIAPEPGFAPAEPTRYYRRIQAEWRALQRELPVGVTVKVNEQQMQFMKILVQGPMHTPYYQGLYAFDVFFPPLFPTAPPIVKFASYNTRMNPNLYDDGRVCLSLLGTWQGKSTTEQWNPASSNILQLVLALQAMILCKEPYYNEPGFEEFMGTEKGCQASRLANEQYYLLKLEHLFKIASQPPPDWQAEVRAHATETLPRLMERAAAYLTIPGGDGATAASASERLMNSDGLVLPLSKGFQVSLGHAIVTLEKHFQKLRDRWTAEESS